MTDDKFLLLKTHPSALGLNDDLVRQLADEFELVKCPAGSILQRVDQVVDSIYFLIHGRVQLSLYDIQGNLLSQSCQSAGGQVGAASAALGEPIPLAAVALDPSTLLKVDYRQLLKLTGEHETFRRNVNYLVAESIRGILLKDRYKRKPKLVAVFHQDPSTRPITRKICQRLHELGEKIAVFSDHATGPKLKDLAFFSLLEKNQYIPGERIRAQINALGETQRIIVDVDASIEPAIGASLFEAVEMVYWCVTESTWLAAIPMLDRFISASPSWREKTNIVWLLSGGQSSAPVAPGLKKLGMQDFKISLEQPSTNQNRELLNGSERIIHHLRGLRIGLALGGGAARGMAHLGVLKALEENGIIIDRIVGTSAGAMTGIVYASGMAPDYSIACFMHDLKPPWFFRWLKNGGYWYLLWKYRMQRFDPMLRKYLNTSRLEQLAVPVASITVDLISGEAVVRMEGDATHAITESINLPLLSTPINRDGRALVDGGIVNNVPADVLVSLGCNFVIAVSVTDQIKSEFASNRPDTPTEKMKPASALETILRTYIVQNVNMNSVGVRPADYIIRPDISEFDLTEFTRADEMSEIGQATTLAEIPKLKEALAKLDPELFGKNETTGLA